jgi:hypothetical protein
MQKQSVSKQQWEKNESQQYQLTIQLIATAVYIIKWVCDREGRRETHLFQQIQCTIIFCLYPF